MRFAENRRTEMKNLFKVITATSVLIFALEEPGITQSTEDFHLLTKEIEQLKDAQISIQKDLQEIKTLLRNRTAGSQIETTDLVLTVNNAPYKGGKDAKVVIIEFSDYACSYCARHVRQTFPQLEKDYLMSGKIKYVLRDFPLESIHPNAFKAAVAARCAAEQGQYWQMHDRIFANQKALTQHDLSEHAQVLGLKIATFQECLDTGEKSREVHKDIADAQKAGVIGTPTFFLGFQNKMGPDVKAVRIIRGAVPYSVFKETIEGLLLESQKVLGGF